MISTAPTLETYLALVTKEHQNKPNFMATVAAEIQPFVDIMNTLYSMLGMFNPNATGDQLDKFAEWVGVSRKLTTPITGVYFAWGTEGVGWGQGTWLGPEDSAAGLTVLPDDAFQILVKLVIAMNNWDGTIPGAYTIWNAVMGSSFPILIQDNQDMTMLVVFTSAIESVVTLALITGGYFNMRPAGVKIAEFAKPSVANTPVFGFGAENSSIAGWGVGCWIEPLT
jgi:hypothetical protein